MIDYDRRLYVYWNLHRKLWSVKQSGRVVGHHDLIFLKDCRFLVSKAGQARVRREKKKNVHAGVSGYLAMNAEVPHNEMGCYVMYNPYKHDTFIQRTGVCDDTHPIPVTKSEFAKMYVLDGKPIVGAVNPYEVNNA